MPPWPEARRIAASTLSLGMFTARAFCMMRRSAGLLSGLGPAAFTAIEISRPMRVNALAMRSQRANIVALRVSKMRPMIVPEDGVLEGGEIRPRASSASRDFAARVAAPRVAPYRARNARNCLGARAAPDRMGAVGCVRDHPAAAPRARPGALLALRGACR